MKAGNWIWKGNVNSLKKNKQTKKQLILKLCSFKRKQTGMAISIKNNWLKCFCLKSEQFVKVSHHKSFHLKVIILTKSL